jgi:hypothetical protein
MKRLAQTAIISALVFASFASRASAGVVMSETAVAKGPGAGDVQKRTIYIQGNKQKVERGDVDAITDLDRNVIYLVDRNQKEYVELPLKSQLPADSENSDTESIRLNNTGHKRVVGGHGCQEYRGAHSNPVRNVAISVCVSDQVPGVNEVVAFQQRMFSQLGVPQEKDQAPGPDASGLVLEKLSVVSFRVPDLSHENSFRTASFVTKTDIDNIQVKSLPDNTFRPPQDFTKLGGNIVPTGPGQLQPNTDDHNEYDVMAPADSESGSAATGLGLRDASIGLN